MPIFYKFTTRPGTFRIIRTRKGWEVFFEDEPLGIYNDPQMALDDLAGGHSSWPSCGDPSQLGIPDDLSEWMIERR